METKIKILIIEHDTVDIELLHHELKTSEFAYVSEVVYNEQDYVNALKNFVPDIILSDYTFPSFDGPSAFKLREKMAPDTPFIFVTGAIGEERSIELIKCGVTDYCLKDNLFTLNHKVIRALKESKEKQQKKLIEEELINSEKRIARAQQVAHTGNWELIFATNMLYWSDETFRIYGLIPNKSSPSLEYALSFIHSEDLNFVINEIETSRKSLHDFDLSYRIVQNNGSIRHVYLDCKLEVDSEGKANGWYGITQDVTDMILLENKLTKERLTRLKEITDAVLTAQEKERAEIGKELHDNLNQILGATQLYIELARKDKSQVRMCLEKASGYITNVIAQIRNISKNLVVPSMDKLGLFDCIKTLINDLSILHPIKIIFLVEGIKEEELEEKLQLNIFRIVQEQLNNILKHAKATMASITITKNEDEIILLISDNGKGYDTTKTRAGVGIRNIMSRAEFFQGTIKIKSKTGEGYELKVELPFDKTYRLEPVLQAS